MANVAFAQEPDTKQQTASTSDDTVIFPRKLVGIRGGVNLSDMAYSHNPIKQHCSRRVWLAYLGTSNWEKPTSPSDPKLLLWDVPTVCNGWMYAIG